MADKEIQKKRLEYIYSQALYAPTFEIHPKLCIGKYADLTVFDMDHISTLPMFDPMSHLVYAASREEVSHVWVNGLLQYEEGHLTSIDIKACKDIALRWQLKLKQNI